MHHFGLIYWERKSLPNVWFSLNHKDDDLDFTYNCLTLTFFNSRSSDSFDLFELI